MKTKITLLLLTVLFNVSTLLAQSRETREMPTFTKIAFRVPGNLYLKQGSPQKVEMEGNKEILQKIETEVDNGKLIIGKESKWMDWNWGDWNDKDRINVYITVKDIEALSVSGSGNLIGEGKFSVGSLDLNVSGSGSLTIDADASGDVEADVSGSGDVNLKTKCKNYDSDVSGSGKVILEASISGQASFGISGSGKIQAGGIANDVKASISGSGRVMASNLEADKCEVRISGSGDVEINVKSQLDANISGSGSVTYKGNPNHVNSHASGSGHIKKM